MPDDIQPDGRTPDGADGAPPAPLSTNAPTSTRPHYAARWEDKCFGLVGGWLRRRKHWEPRVESYTGYGDGSWVRVIARAVLAPPEPHAKDPHDRRGWRSYLGVPAPREVVRIEIAGTYVVLLADRDGYVDARIELPGVLPPGRHAVRLIASNGEATESEVLVIDPRTTFGVVSDIDDTIMDTRLPRPLIAAWNTFVLHPRARRSVSGMADFYERVRRLHPDAPFVYLSTGAWTTTTTLRRFLDVHGFPDGPMLLTDWGPTNTGWFRSAAAHKRAQLERLVTELPAIRWLLVGDDGQHDPQIYAQVAAGHPQHVAAIAIRQLTPTQQVLSHGLPVALRPGGSEPDVPIIQGSDGEHLRRAFLGVFPSRDDVRDGAADDSGDPGPP